MGKYYTEINAPTVVADGHEAARLAAESLEITQHCAASWEQPAPAGPWVIEFCDCAPANSGGVFPAGHKHEPLARASVARDGTVTEL